MFLDLGLTANLLLFAGAALVVGVCGVLLTAKAETLARVTGLGQAILGAVVLGALTSLAGTITSVTSAWSGAAELAFGNAIGGIAAQTTFLVIADALYRKANLEHAAASEENLMQGVLLVVLLAIPLLGIAGPGFTFWSIDLTSLAILAAYLFGIRLLAHSHRVPMLYPRRTNATAEPEPQRLPSLRAGDRGLWLSFLLLAAAVGASGWVIAQTGIALSRQTGLSETLVGTLFTAVVTSIPELVIAIAAVKRGALTLAVGDILGGNTFDVLFLVFSDIAYRSGSLYHAVSTSMVFWLALNILLTGILLTGLLRRERRGPFNIGFEGILVLAVYLIGVTIILL
ncbi:sodium:calcium antiporter [Marinobacterium rhizophilum]|uniref:Sodium:calcium antiporter n=1 Tax=Marinobacterium rhizophilum TaxID=420402 RepID=A0ABY5HM71_9GAMM|nr:sodium:calcium antiporter [Marinobacterium rhizophilum]UTW12693.1 sodium:calcium antiporter [Marinobacterium rhizophilum]